MTRYGYARVSTRDQNPASQYDTLVKAGVEPENIVIEKISGKAAARPKLDGLLQTLQPKDQVVVTRLRRIGHDHKHLLGLAAWFEMNDVDLVLLEEGIDTSTPIGRQFFRTMAALAGFEREVLVEGRRDVADARVRARGRVGGRPAKLTQHELAQAQRMYDADRYTVEEIATMFGVARSTLFKHLAAHKDDRDCVMVVYRNTRPGKIDLDTNRRYGETGPDEKVQYEADSKWFPIAPARRTRVKGFVYVVNGVVTRVRAVEPDGHWHEDHRGYAAAPLTKPLTEVQLAEQFPTLGLRLEQARPHIRGKIREYLPL
jgi:DNA invertase Pin-like site-specific DNA recombinase